MVFESHFKEQIIEVCPEILQSHRNCISEVCDSLYPNVEEAVDALVWMGITVTQMLPQSGRNRERIAQIILIKIEQLGGNGRQA